MNCRNLFCSLFLLLSSIAATGMEYGLRFKSHSSPGRERTSLLLGKPFKLGQQLSVSFDMSLYDSDCFGLICSITGNDGTSISLVSAANGKIFNPGIIIDKQLYRLPSEFIGSDTISQHISITLDKSANNLIVKYGEDYGRFQVNLTAIEEATITFGATYEQNIIAPMEIRDIVVSADNNPIHAWKLREHQTDSVKDHINGQIAEAKSSIWILDEHINWSKIYANDTQDLIQTAFDPKTDLFYIVSQKDITIFNPRSNTSSSIEIDHDGRVMKYSNYLVFDTLTNTLLSYDIDTKHTSRFDFNTRRWDNMQPSDSLPNHSNHGYASDGKNAYLFGGYGFYNYHNNLTKLDLASGEMENLTISPAPQPRASSSMCVVGDKLYIFAGFGNHLGNQEIPSTNYYDMWEYDIPSLKGRMLWSTDAVTKHFLPSSTMYYFPQDSCFYYASTMFGGCMMKTYIDKAAFEQVSAPIHSKMDYRDCVFNLYQSGDQHTFYLVIDKRVDASLHDYAIYRLVYPFVNFNTLSQERVHERKSNSWITILIIFTLIICAFIWLRFLRRKHRITTEQKNRVIGLTDTTISDSATVSSTDGPDSQPTMVIEKSSDNFIKSFLSENSSPVRLFDMNRSSISVLGGFTIMDRDGNEVTPSFRSRMKAVLIMLILYSEKDEKGVNCQIIDEKIWPDMDEKSAKKNRNVCIHKLRQLLGEVGNVEICYDKGYYKLVSSDIIIDYHEVMKLLNLFETEGSLSGEKLDQTIELLLRGPLLPNTAYEWLDKFKSGYTEFSLHILNKLIQYEKNNENDETITYKAAEIISLHDPLNEDALIVKCHILHNRNMRGLAKEIYDSFCRQYKESYGEEYNIPFSGIFKSSDD